MRRLAPIMFILGVLACVAYGGVSDWASVTLRPFYFQADRGVVTDSVATLSGDTVTVIVSRAYMDSTNATIWAYPAIYTGADTAGQGIVAHYVQGTNSRHLWYVEDVPFAAYNFYEVGGTPDTALVELQNIVITGRAIPDSSFVTQVPRGSIPDTLGPGGSGQFVIQGYLLATAINTGAITPSTGGTSTPVAVYGWVPIVQPDARGDSVKFGPRTGTQSVRAMFEDRTGNTTTWWTIYPAALDSAWTWTPPPNTGTTGQVLMTDGTGVTSWETVAGTGDVTGAGVANRYLAVADSTGPNPRFKLNLTDASSGADSFLVATSTGALRFSKGDGSGGGSGDLTAIGKLHNFLTLADSTGPIPKISLNLTTTDARWINEPALAAGAQSVLVSDSSGVTTWSESPALYQIWALDYIGSNTVLAGASLTAGSIIVSDGSSNTSTITYPSSGSNVAFNLPISNGTNNYPLLTNGSGTTSWAQLPSSGLAAGAVGDSSKVAAGSITRTKIASGSITAVQIMDGQVKSGELAAGAVADSSKIGAGAVTRTKIAAGCVTAVQIMDGQVKSAELAVGSVADSTKVAAAAITATRIGASAIHTGQIKDGQVKSADLATGAIGDSAKIAANVVTPRNIKANDTPATGEFLAYTAGEFYWSAGGGGGDNVSVNGSAATDADLDDATPAAPAGGVNVKWQKDSGTPNNVSGYIDLGTIMASLRKKPYFFTDFLGMGSSLTIAGDVWYKTAVASGTTSTSGTAATLNHPGVQIITSSASSNSGCTWNTITQTPIILGGGEYFGTTFQVKQSTNLSFRAGWEDAALPASVTEGAWIEIAGTTLTAYADANGSATAADTTYTISADTWYRLEIHANADASVFYYYMFDDAGTRLWRESLATDLPTGSSDFTGCGVQAIEAVNPGTTAVLVWIDYISMWYTRALAR